MTKEIVPLNVHKKGKETYVYSKVDTRIDSVYEGLLVFFDFFKERIRRGFELVA
ncbi:hypothetical protein [Gemella sp.]